MKKIILMFNGIILSVISFAQFSLGVQATGALGSAHVKSKYDIDFDKSMKAFPGGGMAVQYDVGKRFSLRSGIVYSQQGTRLKSSFDEFVKTTTDTRLNYLQVPVHAIYTISTGRHKLYAGLGGYAGYGFRGEVKNTLWFYTEDGGYDFTEKLPAFKKSEDDGGNLQRLDYGVSGLAGLQLQNGWFVQAGYQYGLANIDRDKENKYRNNGAQLTIGYFFRRSR